MKTAIQFDDQIFTRQRDALMGQVVDAVNGYFTIYSIYLGHRLGLYAALSNGDRLTSKQLAFRTNTHERYVREWLEQQAMIGILFVADEKATAQKRRYYLPSGHAEVLLNRESFNYLAPLAQAVVGVARPRGGRTSQPFLRLHIGDGGYDCFSSKPGEGWVYRG